MARLHLQHLSGSRNGYSEWVPLARNTLELKLGRDPACELAFDPAVDTTVSRHHAAIQWQREDTPGSVPHSFILVDLLSSNGTYLNGRRLEQPEALKSGDVIELGRGGPSIRLSLELESATSSAPDTQTVPKLFTGR
jgi:serine protease Do